MIYHFKKKLDNNNKSFNKNNIEFIMFLNKMLFEIEIKYWFIKLKIIILIWAIKKLRLFIFNLNYFIIILIDYDVSFLIIIQIKFVFNNIDWFNIKFIHVLTYFS